MSETDTGSQVRWLSIFVDVSASHLEGSAAFWTAVTGSRLGTPVGDHEEFVPLDPPDGDPCVWLQRTRDDTSGCHPDLYVEDVAATAHRATSLGAVVSSRHDGLVVLRSPGGLPFCLVRWRGQDRRPGPVGDSDGLVDQLCLDIPPRVYDDECRFWADLTGWELFDDEPRDEFRRLRRPLQVPHAFLLQRLDDDQPTASAHVDLSAGDRAGEIQRHVDLGAAVVEPTEHWTVMRDPVGLTYCITGRRPGDV
jgi:hypothetical protein